MGIDVYQIVTDAIVERLEKGTVPWHRPWNGGEAPANLVSKKEYRGINPFLLGCRGFASPYWVTYKQARAKGGQVRKGEKGTRVIFWKFLESRETGKDGKAKRFPLLRYYTVFNVEQCDDLTAPATQSEGEALDFTSIESAERVAAQYVGAPDVAHGEPRAYYVPATDRINMPKQETFHSREEYYSTLFHEFTHSTGHKSRLNRPTLVDVAPFGSTNYSKEELVAEMGAAMLCGVAGIENRTIDNSAAYLQGWLKKLRNDPKMVVQAASLAQKAADHIRGIRFDSK